MIFSFFFFVFLQSLTNLYPRVVLLKRRRKTEKKFNILEVLSHSLLLSPLLLIFPFGPLLPLHAINCINNCICLLLFLSLSLFITPTPFCLHILSLTVFTHGARNLTTTTTATATATIINDSHDDDYNDNNKNILNSNTNLHKSSVAFVFSSDLLLLLSPNFFCLFFVT